MAEEKVITKDQHDNALLRQELKAHQEGCVRAQKSTENWLSGLSDQITRLADRQIKMERVLWIGLGVLATLQFMVPMIKYFVTLMGGSQ